MSTLGDRVDGKRTMKSICASITTKKMRGCITSRVVYTRYLFQPDRKRRRLVFLQRTHRLPLNAPHHSTRGDDGRNKNTVRNSETKPQRLPLNNKHKGVTFAFRKKHEVSRFNWVKRSERKEYWG